MDNFLDDFFNGVREHMNNNQSLEDKIMEVLLENPTVSLSDWALANIVYNGCMNTKNPANGARIANIKKACFRSGNIMQTGDGSYSLA